MHSGPRKCILSRNTEYVGRVVVRVPQVVMGTDSTKETPPAFPPSVHITTVQLAVLYSTVRAVHQTYANCATQTPVSQVSLHILPCAPTFFFFFWRSSVQILNPHVTRIKYRIHTTFPFRPSAFEGLDNSNDPGRAVHMHASVTQMNSFTCQLRTSTQGP